MSQTSNHPSVNLYSDTQSQPTAAMREFMLAATVGDEQRGEDPTTCALEAQVANLLGMEAAVFLPSGTMCNEIAYRVHCGSGDEIILDRTGHALHFEVGAPAALSGAMTTGLDGHRGRFTAAQVEQAIRPINRHQPQSRLVSVENTTNLGGGAVWPLEQIREVCGVAHTHGLATHMDGARLMNAVVASGISAAEFSRTFDSAWIDLSKGLGAPIGGVLAGTSAFIDRCWRFKHQFGGAMRQSGIIAAAGLYALEHHVERLAEDHANARRLAELLYEVPGITLEREEVETNMVYFNVAKTGLDASHVSTLVEQRGVRIGAFDAHTMRAVTYLDVDASAIETAGSVVASVIAEHGHSRTA